MCATSNDGRAVIGTDVDDDDWDDSGGEVACLIEQICAECGVVIGDAAHRSGCEDGPSPSRG